MATSLKERLDGDLKDAMRNKDSVRRTVLRTIISEIRNAEIAKQEALDDEGVLVVMTKRAQQRRDSIEAFERGNRPDLVQKEKSELAFIVEYLPEPMLRDDIVKLVEGIILEEQAQSLRDMGKVMARVMPAVRGRADGREVSSIVTDLLSDK